MAAAPSITAPPPAVEPPRLATTTPAPRARARLEPIALLTVAGVVVGCLVRAWLVLSQPLPLNDGGLFFQMTRELEAAHFHLPAFTGYNGAHLPYGYPPLGFYLTGLLDRFTPLSLLDAYRVVPLVASWLTLAAFVLLARELLSRRAQVAAATWAFALAPRSYIWMIMGGGVTRGPGFLFGLLTLHQVVRFYRTREWRYVAGAAAGAALTVLSHIGTAPFVAVSSGLLLLACGRHWRALLGSVAIGLGALVLTAPWWATVISQHGVGPFVAAFGTGQGVLSDHEVRRRVLGWLARFAAPITAEPLFPLLAALAVLGGLVCLARLRLLLPVWWVTILLIDARQGPSFMMVPMALLAGIGVVDVVLPAMLGAGAAVGRARTQRRWVAGAVLTAMAGYALFGAMTRDPDLGREGRFLMSLTTGDRMAMHWIGTHTPADSRILVITGAPNGWAADRTSEWLPVWARRTSVATAQGYEWAGGPTFMARRHMYEAFQGCAWRTTQCLDSLARRWDAPFTDVYVSQMDPRTAEPCCRPLLTALRSDPRYRLVYRGGDGGAVFERRDATAHPALVAQPPRRGS